MSENDQTPKTNDNATLGNWLADKYLRPVRKFDEHFPEQSKTAQKAFGTAADEGAKAVKQTANLGKRAAGGVVQFFRNRGTDIVAWGLTIGILAVRGVYNAIDFIAEKCAKPAIKAYRNWEPKTSATRSLKNGLNYAGNKVANAYNGYMDFCMKFNNYPASIPALVGLGGAQAAVSLTGIHYTHEVGHIIATGHGSALHVAAIPALIGVGKCSNLLTLKPAVKLAKTSRDGFFASDLYHQKVKPVYMKRVDPLVKLTQKHIRQWDNLVGNNREKLRERALKAADKIQGGISSVFAKASGTTRPTSEASKTLSNLASTRAPLTRQEPSKLDGSQIKDKWQYVLQPAESDVSSAPAPAENNAPSVERD